MAFGRAAHKVDAIRSEADFALLPQFLVDQFLDVALALGVRHLSVFAALPKVLRVNEVVGAGNHETELGVAVVAILGELDQCAQ